MPSFTILTGCSPQEFLNDLEMNKKNVLNPNFEAFFVKKKNWSAKIGAMLDDEGTSLIIVSQEYLYGENNLRTALAKRGYQLERMP